MKAHEDLRCPVCRAGFRSQTTCSRCGADLSRLMILVAGAYHLRARARRALSQYRYPEAHALAQQAESLHSTALGRKLALTAGAMAMIVVTPNAENNFRARARSLSRAKSAEDAKV